MAYAASPQPALGGKTATDAQAEQLAVSPASSSSSFQLQPPSPTYTLPDGSKTTAYSPATLEYNAANGGTSTIPGVGNVTGSDISKYIYNPGVQAQPQNQTAPQQPATQAPAQNAPQQNLTTPQTVQPAVPQDLTPKYTQTLNALNQSGSTAPASGGLARSDVAAANDQYQSPQQPYAPTPAFMQYGDPIMQTFAQAAMADMQNVTMTGNTAQNLQANFANQVQGLDLQAASMQNIMNGSLQDIRAEINKAGGFATESQVQSLATTRNRDLLVQYNNLELQKQTMQNQMQLQVQLAQNDHQYAVDQFNNVTKSYDMYKGIYDNATTQVNDLINRVGYSGLADAYNNDPSAISLAEQHLNLPQGTLSNPQTLNQLDTYRQKSLALSASRFTANYGYNPNQPGGQQSNTGAPSDNSTYQSGNPPTQVPGGGNHSETNPNVPYEQYGLLSTTNFDPKNPTDINANNYLTQYLNGNLPSKASDLGITIHGAGAGTQYNDAVTRANSLYYAATGQNLPSPDIIKNNLSLINANNTLANKLDTQELTVGSNIQLSLANMTKNGLNSSQFAPLNGLIDYVKNLFNDPATGQLLSQNETIRNELGSLMSVKNASGTTVYDKLSSAGIISSTDTPANIQQKISTLLSEAGNFKSALNTVNGQLYQQTDPLERQQQNPNRQSYLDSQVPQGWVTMTGPKGTFTVDPKNVDVMKQNGYH